MGWLTSEELRWNEQGKIDENYEIPMAESIPQQFNVTLLKDTIPNQRIIFSAKGYSLLFRLYEWNILSLWMDILCSFDQFHSWDRYFERHWRAAEGAGGLCPSGDQGRDHRREEAGGSRWERPPPQLPAFSGEDEVSVW